MRIAYFLVAMAGAAALPLRGQVADPPPVSRDAGSQGAQAQTDTVASPQVTPLGAFLRAVALPSWGHGSIGSHRRGVFYLAAEGGTAWMLLRTASRRASAERVLAAREAVVRARVGLENPGAENLEELVDAAFADDALVAGALRRRDARQNQFEDWMAMGIFLTLLSGADAFVSAHLKDFPDPIEVQVGPAPGGGMEVGARLRVGGGRL